MKLGVSTYSLNNAIQSGQMNVLDVLQWIADQGGEHVEVAPSGFDLAQDKGLADEIRQKTLELGIEVSGYSIGANFIKDTQEAYEKEIERVKQEVDIAHRLGVKFMRHDVASRNRSECTIANFDADLDRLANACRIVADYAFQYGITTSVENHGFYVQASDRVQRLLHAVNRDNYKTTMDVGNFMCVDEDSVVSVKKNIVYASVVHLKDFYRRPAYRDPGEGWFKTLSGNYLRGAIVGQGDIDIPEVIKVIKQSGFDGYITIEFEGMEDCRVGTRIGLENARRLWAEV